jgi:hypothetical protein
MWITILSSIIVGLYYARASFRSRWTTGIIGYEVGRPHSRCDCLGGENNLSRLNIVSNVVLLSAYRHVNWNMEAVIIIKIGIWWNTLKIMFMLGNCSKRNWSKHCVNETNWTKMGLLISYCLKTFYSQKASVDFCSTCTWLESKYYGSEIELRSKWERASSPVRRQRWSCDLYRVRQGNPAFSQSGCWIQLYFFWLFPLSEYVAMYSTFCVQLSDHSATEMLRISSYVFLQSLLVIERLTTLVQS